jgi:hypothetical protein
MATKLQEKKEAEAQKLELALSALARARTRERNRRQLLTEVLSETNPLEFSELPAPIRNAAYGVVSCDTRKVKTAFRELMLHLELHSERLLEAQTEWGANPYLGGLVSLARQHAHWIRPLADWRPASRNVERQFSQLARYLLVRYEAPTFLEAVLHDQYGSDGREGWFRHVGQGGSLRTAPGVTMPLTKRMAHHALQAPDTCSVIQALRWGQVMALGGSPRLAFAVNGTALGCSMESAAQEAWRTTVIQWLVNQPMLDPVHVEPIVIFVLRRQRRERKFSMQGRTPLSVLRLIREWQEQHAARERQREQARERERNEDRSRYRYRYREFPLSGIAPGIWETGRGAQRWLWTIEEIRCNRDLMMEGREMRHCVATYEDSILNGSSSIWSMKVERSDGVQRAVTIEVCPRTRRVEECLGKCNRAPTAEERRMVERWAQDNGLTVELWNE